MTQRATQATASRRRGGFSLMEITVAFASLAILLLSVQSAMLLVARAIPDGKSRASAIVNANRAIDQLASDLQFATAINSARMSATDIEMTVPDRNSDGVAETIRYTWTASAGKPLTRSVNGGTPVVVASAVQEFALAYDKRSAPAPTTYSEGVEAQLFSYDPLLSLGDARVNSSGYRGQYFEPTLPGDAYAWRITRVKFKAKSLSTVAGVTSVQVRTASGGLPTSTVVDQTTMLESMLSSSYTWQEIAFANAGGLSPGSGACIVFAWVSDTDSCAIQLQSLGGLALNANYVTSSNGASWSAPLAQDIPLYVYGVASTPNPPKSLYYLTGVRCLLRTSTDATARVSTSVRVLNEPQVDGP